MNATLINNVVGPDDICLDLGDVSFRPKNETRKFVQSMNGHKFLFKGNHDRGSIPSWISAGYVCAFYWSDPIVIDGIGIGHAPDDVCVEVRGYRPVHGRDILNKADYEAVFEYFRERIVR